MSAGAIIAGGQATRFGGRDKSRLIIDGQSIISRQLAVLQPLTDEVFIVANQFERFADLGLPVHADRIPGTGVIGAILTALEAASSDRVWCIACDLPYLSGPLLSRLDELAAGADGAWVSTDAGVEPLLACYQRTAVGRIREQIAAGRLRAADLGGILSMAEINARELATFGDPARLVANLNTPEALRGLVQ
jgi:molybdopterin-guanine dinucleotide biosynthesis protein A